MSSKNKAKNAAHKKQGPQARVVLFGLDSSGDKNRAQLIRDTIAAQGLAIHEAVVEELSSPVGSFAGMQGFHKNKAPFEGEAPNFEFMLLCNLSGKQIDALLLAMRTANCSIGCKATVTQFNKFWPLSKLLEEISREHAQMSQE